MIFYDFLFEKYTELPDTRFPWILFKIFNENIHLILSHSLSGQQKFFIVHANNYAIIKLINEKNWIQLMRMVKSEKV